MLPTFARHRRRHSLGIAVVVGATCLVLSGLFLLNAPDPNQLECALFIAALCGGICYAAARDTTSYWIYAALAPKFYLPSDGRAGDLETAARIVTARAPLLRSAVTVAVAAAALFWAMDAWSPFARAASVIATTVVVYPLILTAGLHRAAPMYIAVAGLSRSARHRTLKSRGVNEFLIEDTIVALSINLAIVSPLARREPFASPGLYSGAEVLTSHLTLALLVTTTMFIGARRSRLFSAAGEVLSGLVPPDVPGLRRAAAGGALRRLTIGCAVVTAWLLCLAAGLHHVQLVLRFVSHYLLLLIPVAGLYAWERRLTLQRDLTEAVDLLKHLRASGLRPELAEEKT